MGPFRLLWKGIADVFEHLLPYMLASILWWLGVLLVITFPPATIGLFAMTDPRRSIDRPDARELLAQVRADAFSSWKLFLIIIPITGLLIWDLGFYGGSQGGFAVLAPLWLTLLIIAVAVSLAAISTLALTEAGVGTALRRGAFVILSAPFRSLLVLLASLFYMVVGVLLIVPFVLIVPALIAATVNRLVLTQLQIPVIDPMAPTDERVLEQQLKRTHKARR